MKKIRFNTLFLAGLALLLTGLSSCRGDDDPIRGGQSTVVTPGEEGPVKGFYLLNEANMGSNKATIDYFDYETGAYYTNIFPRLNPGVVRELGDVGNDIQIYGDKLYAVLNCSHLVEVMNARTAKHIATIDIKNCRYIVFHEGFAYVSSYKGSVEIDPHAPLGAVVKVDTATLSVVGSVDVGYQPDEMVIRDGKLYVANSGGYRVSSYDRTISVVDLKTFREIKKIDVAINLHRMQLDAQGNIYVSSRGDYKETHSDTYIIDRNDKVVKSLNLPVSNMVAHGDSIYVHSVEWNNFTETNSITYGIINTRTQSVVSRRFIQDGTEKYITLPYGIAVNPENGEVFITDAKDYLSSGTLYCFSPDGRRKWSVFTGDIPARIVFTRHRLETLDELAPASRAVHD
ncbi:YncE family protein [Alistipes sp. OttesenSCG-928-L06]|nr:YncE family protein [Alistipes sp. OttesenSCG-928-L06]